MPKSNGRRLDDEIINAADAISDSRSINARDGHVVTRAKKVHRWRVFVLLFSSALCDYFR